MRSDFFGTVMDWSDLETGDFFITQDSEYGIASQFRGSEEKYAVAFSRKNPEPSLVERHHMGVVLKIDAIVRPIVNPLVLVQSTKRPGVLVGNNTDSSLICTHNRSIISLNITSGIISERTISSGFCFKSWEVVVQESDSDEMHVLFQYPFPNEDEEH